MPNQFNDFKSDFRTDTGLEWDENVHGYILYYLGRVTNIRAEGDDQLHDDLIDIRDKLEEIKNSINDITININCH